jgi:hypothetical protein
MAGDQHGLAGRQPGVGIDPVGGKIALALVPAKPFELPAIQARQRVGA